MTLLRKKDAYFPNVWNDLFDHNFYHTAKAHAGTTVPAVNIKETEDGFQIEMASPGMQKDDFNIKLDQQILTISAKKTEAADESNDKYTRKEYSFSSFSRRFTLPESANTDSISAGYEAGILTVNISKKEEAKPKPSREIAIG